MIRSRIKRGGRFVPLPPGSKWCGRPSRWGNPWHIRFVPATNTFHVGRGDTTVREFAEFPQAAAFAIGLYERYAARRDRAEANWIEPLRAVPLLACECDPESPCHVDVLIDLLKKSDGGRG